MRAMSSAGSRSRLPLPEHAAELGSLHRALDARAAPRPPRVAPRCAHRREPSRPHVARAPAAGLRRNGGIRRVARRGLGRPPGLERQPPLARRAVGRRAPGTSSSASCCTPASSSSSPARSYRTPEVIAVHADSGLTAATQRFHRHLRARPTHPDDATPGARQHVGGGLLRSRPRHPSRRSPTVRPRPASNASSSTTAGSGHGATTRRDWAIGSSPPTPTRWASAR